MIFDGSPEELKQGGSLEEPFYQMTNYGRPARAADAGGKPEANGDPGEKQDSERSEAGGEE